MANFEGIIPLHADYISRTLAVEISGRSIVTTVTQYPVGIRSWIWKLKEIVRNGRIALYTKTVPRQNNNNLPRVVMCSFFANDTCLVAYLGNDEEGVPMPISDFLCYPMYTFVGIRESIEALVEGLDEPDLDETYPVMLDLNSAAAESRNDPLLRDLDLPALSSAVLGYAPVYPANVEHDWERLTDNQIAAITVDAAVIFALGEALAPPPG